MAEFASRGVGNTALGLSIGALGVEALNGGLNGILGGRTTGTTYNCGCSENNLVNRYEATQSARIAELETEVKLRDANFYSLSEMGKLRDYVDNRFNALEKECCDQKVFNATNIATISCIQSQVAQLMGLTKVVVPNSSVCPGWGDVTVTVTPTTTA